MHQNSEESNLRSWPHLTNTAKRNALVPHTCVCTMLSHPSLPKSPVMRFHICFHLMTFATSPLFFFFFFGFRLIHSSHVRNVLNHLSLPAQHFLSYSQKLDFKSEIFFCKEMAQAKKKKAAAAWWTKKRSTSSPVCDAEARIFFLCLPLLQTRWV